MEQSELDRGKGMSAVANPWLSVIMPTYNGASYLDAALSSVCSEATEDVEIVVADDGSSDTTQDILDSYASRISLRVVSRSRVGNWVAGTNLALRSAVGRYACFLHQDDVWLPGRLARIRRALALSPAQLLVHEAEFLDARGRRLGRWRTPFHLSGRHVSSEDFLERLLVQNFIAIPSPVFDRAAALATGGLDEKLWYTADWDFWLRLARLGPVLVVAEPLAGFRVHAASQTLAPTRARRDFEEQLSTVLSRHFEPWAVTVSGRRARCVRAAAEFSVVLNSALAAAYRGEDAGWKKLGAAFVRLGPPGWRRYLRDSRIIERVSARLRLAHRHSRAPSSFG